MMTLHYTMARLWMQKNYEYNPKGVVQKSAMLKKYHDHCGGQDINDFIENNTFGRVVRKVFPQVTARRLGPKDNKKYYYCGIQEKKLSPQDSYQNNNNWYNGCVVRPDGLKERMKVAERLDFDKCFLWLNYSAKADGAVSTFDIYLKYLGHCIVWGRTPISTPHLGRALKICFPKITKKKRGNVAFYVGIEESPSFNRSVRYNQRRNLWETTRPLSSRSSVPPSVWYSDDKKKGSPNRQDDAGPLMPKADDYYMDSPDTTVMETSPPLDAHKPPPPQPSASCTTDIIDNKKHYKKLMILRFNR